MQDAITADPGLGPLVFVEVDSVQVGGLGYFDYRGLFGGLALQELARGVGEDDADGEVGVVGEGFED